MNSKKHPSDADVEKEAAVMLSRDDIVVSTAPVCIDCLPTKKVERPDESKATCSEQYDRVVYCMDRHKQQVRQCQEEWKAFRNCMDRKKNSTRRDSCQ